MRCFMRCFHYKHNNVYMYVNLFVFIYVYVCMYVHVVCISLVYMFVYTAWASIKFYYVVNHTSI